MALDILYKYVPDWENRCVQTLDDGTKRLHPITQTLGFATMTINLHEITEKNWKDFFARVATMESITGPQISLSNGDMYNIQPEDVYNHIGLVTNAGQKTSPERFLNRHAQYAKRDTRRTLENHYNDAKAEANKAAKELEND